MPMINVKLIEGVFNETQKKKMVTALTDCNGRHRRRVHAPSDLGGDRGGQERQLGNRRQAAFGG